MNNIILFATYWNEIEWIKPSLEQILKIDPVEIIICDGNFDPRVENRSTDGTHEVIKEFVRENSGRARMISATRENFMCRGKEFFLKSGRQGEVIKPSRLNYTLRSQLRFNPYRVNQALTFSRMMRMSSKWKEGSWVMTYDADQFYTDELIRNFSVCNTISDLDLITADEWTFPESFSEYTTNYELRKWNNMPHKIKKGIAIYPTRHIVQEGMFTHKQYHEMKNIYHAGVYHHYKFRNDKLRLEAGYKLGDREQPIAERYTGLKKIEDELPEIIKQFSNE
jgi:hypothetical protein